MGIGWNQACLSVCRAIFNTKYSFVDFWINFLNNFNILLCITVGPGFFRAVMTDLTTPQVAFKMQVHLKCISLFFFF
jgi:hypothetical protein